jgi:hypothetical protein
MARYIKANYKVAQYLHLESVRNRVTDGNYLLWQADMLAFGRLIDLPQILSKIGAISLSAKEAKEEQDGTVVRELPTAEDETFVIEPAEAEREEDTATADETVETVTEEGQADEEEPISEKETE